MPNQRPDRERLRSIWPFWKPKTPGFGVSRDFYLTVLSTTNPLPTSAQVLNPSGKDGAVKGFAVPLKNETDKKLLERPMERGAYALASPDRKTVLRLLVMPKEEAQFDPTALLRTEQGVGISEEIALRLKAVWQLMQLTFEAHDPVVYPSLDFILEVAERLGTLTEGVVSDPICERYLLPQSVRVPLAVTNKVDARNFITTRFAQHPHRQVFTLGMIKFALPELSFADVEPDLFVPASELLVGIAQGILESGPLQEGLSLGLDDCPFLVTKAPVEGGYWEGIPRWEFVPMKGDTSSAIAKWHSELRR
ncbi:MAG: hypothetical protein ACK4P3_02090 [Fimbriimonadaceae bacterium]